MIKHDFKQTIINTRHVMARNDALETPTSMAGLPLKRKTLLSMVTGSSGFVNWLDKLCEAVFAAAKPFQRGSATVSI